MVEKVLDTGLWITWYDLSADGRSGYLSWLQETYVPGLLQRPGFLWAAHYASMEKEQMATTSRSKGKSVTNDDSVPKGSRYILIVGAQNANVFLNPVPTTLHAEMSDHDKKMLALRIGERTNIMTEFARVDGPAAKDYKDGMALAPCVQLGSYDCLWQRQEEMLNWYTKWRMAAMGRTPGCIRTRKLVSLTGWGKHAVLYEFVSAEARNEYYPKHDEGYPEMKVWSGKVVQWLTHAPGSPYLATRLWPPVPSRQTALPNAAAG